MRAAYPIRRSAAGDAARRKCREEAAGKCAAPRTTRRVFGCSAVPSSTLSMDHCQFELCMLPESKVALSLLKIDHSCIPPFPIECMTALQSSRGSSPSSLISKRYPNPGRVFAIQEETKKHQFQTQPPHSSLRLMEGQSVYSAVFERNTRRFPLLRPSPSSLQLANWFLSPWIEPMACKPSVE